MNIKDLIELCQQGDTLIDEDLDYEAVDEKTLIIYGVDDDHRYATDLKIVIEGDQLFLFCRDPEYTGDGDNPIPLFGDEWVNEGCFGNYDDLRDFVYRL